MSVVDWIHRGAAEPSVEALTGLEGYLNGMLTEYAKRGDEPAIECVSTKTFRLL